MVTLLFMFIGGDRTQGATPPLTEQDIAALYASSTVPYPPDLSNPIAIHAGPFNRDLSEEKFLTNREERSAG